MYVVDTANRVCVFSGMSHPTESPGCFDCAVNPEGPKESPRRSQQQWLCNYPHFVIRGTILFLSREAVCWTKFEYPLPAVCRTLRGCCSAFAVEISSAGQLWRHVRTDQPEPRGAKGKISSIGSPVRPARATPILYLFLAWVLSNRLAGSTRRPVFAPHLNLPWQRFCTTQYKRPPPVTASNVTLTDCQAVSERCPPKLIVQCNEARLHIGLAVMATLLFLPVRSFKTQHRDFRRTSQRSIAWSCTAVLQKARLTCSIDRTLKSFPKQGTTCTLI